MGGYTRKLQIIADRKKLFFMGVCGVENRSGWPGATTALSAPVIAASAGQNLPACAWAPLGREPFGDEATVLERDLAARSLRV